MDQVLQGLRWSRCLVYLDDIISFGTTFEDALDNLTLIFERLRTYGLQLKSTKCHLFQTSVPFLGHVVGRRGLECDPRKIEDVKSWPVPDCLKSVRQFLGFVGYYRRFIPSLISLRMATSMRDCIPSITGRTRPGPLPKLGTIYWKRMPIILAWEEFSVRSRMMRSVSSPIAVAPFDHPSENTAPRKCWQLSPCVYSFVHIYAVLNSPSGRITNLLSGSIGLRIQRV